MKQKNFFISKLKPIKQAKIFKKLMLSLFTLLLLLCSNTNAFAAGCSLGGSINFGTYDPVSKVSNSSSANLTVTCSLISIFNLSLGTGQSGNYLSRIMTSGAPNTDKLQYNLYLNSGHTSIFGDGTEGTSSLNQISIKIGATTVPIYGLIPAQQNISAGAYTDSVAIMITF
jgi:spore coat protein U-like protein